MSDTEKMTITEFLEARIAEDEALANAASISMHGDKHKESWDWGSYVLGAERDSTEKQDEFITTWWPTRILAECKAKRVIIASASDKVMWALASVYVDHPDYLEMSHMEWINGAALGPARGQGSVNGRTAG